MKTDLNSLFQKISLIRDGQYEPFSHCDSLVDSYEEYISTLRNSRSFRLHCRLDKPEELWSTSRIGVILCDSTTMSGYAPAKSGEFRIVAENINRIGELFDIMTLQALGRSFLGFAHFDDEIVSKWIEDASPFIDDGRLLYMPQKLDIRCRGRLPNGRPDWTFDSNNSELQSTIDAMRDAEREGSSVLIADLRQQALVRESVGVLSAAMPFIDGISLKSLHTILEDEEDTLINFRKTMSLVIPTHLDEMTTIDSPDKIKAAGIEIRRNLLEPEIAGLNRSFNKIVQTRAARLLGASVATVSLGIAALSSGGLAALISSVLGAGGIGAVANEYSGFRGELLDLKDNPYYFAWQLKRRI